MPDAVILDADDLPAEVVAKIDPGDLMLWLEGLNAAAFRVAPCLREGADPPPSDEQLAEARMILRGALQQWADAGSGAFQQQTAGPFTVTSTPGRTGYKLTPTEERALAKICRAGKDRKAFMIDQVPDQPAGGLENRPDLWFQWRWPVGDAP